MPFVTSATLGEYDAIVVGSGAAGGQTAYTLAMEGASVLMLEAGRRYLPESETPMFQTPGQAPLRGAATTDKPFGFYDATVDGGWQVPGEPYVNTSQDDAERFDWWRARMLGGRTNHWGRYSFRNGPYDFKPKSRDGLGFDWPLTYEDLVTRESFGDFELELEWKLSEGGNAGIFYRGTREYDYIYWSAPEYQLLDDARHPDGRNRLTSAAAAYALYAAPVGIVVKGAHVEHWLNGQKVVTYELWSPDWKAKVAASKFSKYPNYGLAKSGLIGIQGDHAGTLTLRGIRILELR